MKQELIDDLNAIEMLKRMNTSEGNIWSSLSHHDKKIPLEFTLRL